MYRINSSILSKKRNKTLNACECCQEILLSVPLLCVVNCSHASSKVSHTDYEM